MKTILIVATVFAFFLAVVPAGERNRHDLVLGAIPSHSVDDRYDNGAPRFVWVEEPAVVELSIGTVEVEGLLSFSSNGFVDTVAFAGAAEINTPGGQLLASAVTFHEEGALKLVHAWDEQPIQTPLGPVRMDEHVLFFENGVIEEVRLAESVEVSGSFGSLIVDGVLGFHESGNIRTMQAEREQNLISPDGGETPTALVNLHEDGTPAVIQFARPTRIDTGALLFEDAVVTVYDREGTLEIVLTARPGTYETPGGPFTLPAVVLLPDGSAAGGLLTRPEVFSTPLGNMPLIAVVFDLQGRIERAAPVEPRSVDGVVYDLQNWMRFDAAGRLEGGFAAGLF